MAHVNHSHMTPHVAVCMYVPRSRAVQQPGSEQFHHERRALRAPSTLPRASNIGRVLRGRWHDDMNRLRPDSLRWTRHAVRKTRAHSHHCGGDAARAATPSAAGATNPSAAGATTSSARAPRSSAWAASILRFKRQGREVCTPSRTRHWSRVPRVPRAIAVWTGTPWTRHTHTHNQWRARVY